MIYFLNYLFRKNIYEISVMKRDQLFPFLRMNEILIFHNIYNQDLLLKYYENEIYQLSVQI
jgi:hypothetical protein